MASIGKQQLTQGWYITGGICVGIAFGNTRAAPLILGVLTVALIYQLTALVEGTPPGGTNTPGVSTLPGSQLLPGGAPLTSSAGSTTATVV